jgi:hypothetical protein
MVLGDHLPGKLWIKPECLSLIIHCIPISIYRSDRNRNWKPGLRELTQEHIFSLRAHPIGLFGMVHNASK